MGKKVAIHQPNFLPWIGYFHKMAMVDQFILFDDVQFPRGKSYGNRVQIKANDNTMWLTVPAKSKSDLPLFNEVTIDYQSNWPRKMNKTIFLNYKKASHFDFFYDDLSKLLDQKYEYLFELNSSLIKLCADKLKMDTTLVTSSQFDESSGLSGDEKILKLLELSDAGEYLSGKGAGSRRYIDESVFEKRNIKLTWQTIKEGYSYNQLGSAFIPNLSIIDLIFNEGPNALNVLKEL